MIKNRIFNNKTTRVVGFVHFLGVHTPTDYLQFWPWPRSGKNSGRFWFPIPGILDTPSDGQITSLGKMRVGQPANQIPYMTRNPPMIVFKSSDWPFWLVGLIRNLQKVKIWVLRESNLGKWQHISRIFFFFWLRSQIFGFGLARQPMERFEQSEILTLLVLFHQWKRL